jgi:hypothetical protein
MINDNDKHSSAKAYELCSTLTRCQEARCSQVAPPRGYLPNNTSSTDYIGRSFVAIARFGLYAFVTIALCATHLLLPVERGFPPVRIAGLPFTVTILVTVAAFLPIGGRVQRKDSLQAA